MEKIGTDWSAIIFVIGTLMLWSVLFVKTKSRISKLECIMGEIVCLFGFLCYFIPKTRVLSSEIATVGVSISFGIIAGIALLVIGLIEIKIFDHKSL